jgi:Avidin family
LADGLALRPGWLELGAVIRETLKKGCSPFHRSKLQSLFLRFEDLIPAKIHSFSVIARETKEGGNAMPLDGDWYNELGSKMTLEVHGQEIRGRYFTAVGDAEGIYHLSGRTNESNTILGFSVAWQNSFGDSESATAWSGQYLSDEDEILTTWLLTDQTDEADEWKSTNIGQDVFQRQAPNKQTIQKAVLLRAPSHPARSRKKK